LKQQVATIITYCSHPEFWAAFTKIKLSTRHYLANLIFPKQLLVPCNSPLLGTIHGWMCAQKYILVMLSFIRNKCDISKNCIILSFFVPITKKCNYKMFWSFLCHRSKIVRLTAAYFELYMYTQTDCIPVFLAAQCTNANWPTITRNALWKKMWAPFI
jgi:hypothetical protein